jgi:hypothetical protein
MYSYFGTLAVPAVVMGCVQILGAVMATVLYIDIKFKDNKVYIVTVM